MPGPMTNAERENRAVKTTKAIAGARQVWNLRRNRRSSGIENSRPRAKNSRLPPVPVTSAAPAIRPMRRYPQGDADSRGQAVTHRPQTGARFGFKPDGTLIRGDGGTGCRA